ncbi:hypothetical protein KSP40_PGU013730 [Platanthera guangdongensis]|uniref:Uncharacterized protein n=1 Tax=Platanthera guangdongensis TaxID=2320717 RepID=A0ABR2LU77_9ASPA
MNDLHPPPEASTAPYDLLYASVFFLLPLHCIVTHEGTPDQRLHSISNTCIPKNHLESNQLKMKIMHAQE